MAQLGRPVVNKYKVPERQWTKWSSDARRVFNALYYAMRPAVQFAFIHPDAPPVSKKHWETTRWNAAWVAACAVDKTSHVAKILK